MSAAASIKNGCLQLHVKTIAYLDCSVHNLSKRSAEACYFDRKSLPLRSCWNGSPTRRRSRYEKCSSVSLKGRCRLSPYHIDCWACGSTVEIKRVLPTYIVWFKVVFFFPGDDQWDFSLGEKHFQFSYWDVFVTGKLVLKRIKHWM